MLGAPKLRRINLPIAVSLADFVLADNVYRHLEVTLDLSLLPG